jgi:hypothetical protein
MMRRPTTDTVAFYSLHDDMTKRTSAHEMDDLTLQNMVSYSASLGRVCQNGRLGVLASFSGYTEIIDTAAPPLQTALGLNYQFGGGAYSLNGTVSAGLSESMPDVSMSLGCRAAL